MPFPGVTIPPETDYNKLLDTLQRFFNAAMPYWKSLTPYTPVETITFPVGTIILTSTNNNPSSDLGGIWESY